MNKSVYRILLNLQKYNSGIMLYASDMDYGIRAISAAFADGDMPYEFDTDASVIFIASTPEHKTVEVEAKIENNVVTVDVPDEVIDGIGMSLCKFVINGVGLGKHGPVSRELHSPIFTIDVQSAVLGVPMAED